MGEIAALSRAFDTEFNKHYEALPRLAHDPDHDAFLNHYRQVQRIAESIAYYASRLPPYASVHRILAFGDRLAQRGEHRLALEACYSYVKLLNIHQRNVVRADELTCLSWHVQACYGVAVCEATLVLHQDPQMKHPDTLAAVVVCLHQLKDVLVLVLPSEQLYWLTLNGTLHIYTLAKRLLTAGYVAQMLPFMVFCVKALESHVIFSTSKYLTWRTQLYISLCYAYCDVREHGMAKQVVQEGLSKIDALIKLQKLDPVPAPPEVQAAYRTAKAMLCALKLKLEVICAPSGPGALSTPEKPTPAKGGGGKGQAKSNEKGKDKSEGGLNELVNAAWQPLLAEVGDTQKAKLTAMLEAMQVPGRRVVRHEPVEGALKDMFELAHFEASPLVKHLTAILQQQEQQQEEQQQQQPQQQHPHQQGGHHGDSTGSTAGEGGAAAAGRPGSASSMQSKSAGEGALHHGHHPHGLSHLHPQAHQRHHFNPPEAEEFSLLLHTALLCTAYNFEQGEAVDELLELARLRLARGAVGFADEGQVAVFSAVTALLGALRRLDTAPGTESLHHLSRTLASVYSVAARVVADIVTDAALVLYAEAKPLLNGVYCKRDQEAELVLGILRTLHACFEAVDLDDAVLRLSVSLKLALLLEEQDGGSTDKLHQARDVLRSTRVVVERFRCEASLMMRGQPHEHLHWITASRNQPNDAVAKLVSGMPDTDQELACLHVDVLSTLYRVELAVGVAEQQAQALFQQAMLAENVKRREAQSSIFGVRTMKERRLDEQRIMQAATTSSNPPLKERELLQACGKNPYEKALALTAMAPLQAEPHRQLALLQEAALCLTKAQDQEDALFAAAQPEQKGKAAGPLQPKVLHRTPTSCTLTHFPFNLKGNKRVAKYAVYAKVFGAGVALILNKTASEYPGTGAMMPPGTPVTVEGLRTNDTYVFAIAAYDDSGALIGELGTSSTETLAGLPLPLYHCWAHLLLMACRLRLWPIANHASNVLLPHFIKTGPDRPLWEANPMDAQVIHRPHVEVATRALLRIFVQAVYAHTGAGLSKHEALPASTTANSTSPPPPLADLRMPYANEQIARLKSVKRLLLAMVVAVVLHDEMLIQEGAVRVYHMLGPLLVLKAKSPMIHKALAKTHICLQDIANLVQMSQTGQEALRMTAARVSSAVAYNAIMMATTAREEGSVKFFARLDVELMKAYDPRFSVPGRPPVSELLGEGAALQELLLCHERSSEFAEEGGVIGERIKDEDDVVAGALPFLAQPNPLEVWNHLGRVDVVDHPRWVELMVRAIEASVRKGKLENLEALAGQVMWHVRSKLQCPPVATYPYEPKWDLEAAAAEYADVTLEPEEEPPKPDLTSLLDVNTAAEEEAWLAAREAVLMQARRRHAAAALLQRRLPLLLARLRVVREIRQLAMQWAPWMARLNTVLGLAKTYEGRCCVEAALHIKDPPADSPDNPPPINEEASEVDTSKSASAQKAAKGAPAKGKEAKAGPTAAASTTAAATVFAATASIPKAALMAVPLQALLHLARGVQLAVRGQAWHEALNAVRHLWNSTRALVNAAPSLLEPTPALQWELGEMPPGKQPPESLLIAPKEGKGAKGAKKEEPAKVKPGAKGAKAGTKGAPVAGEVPPEPTWPQVPLPQNAKEHNIARTLRAAVEALLSLVAAIKAGTPLYTGVIPLADSPRNRPALEAEPSASGQPRPGSAISTAYASSNFSFGSDLVAELWFRKTSLDMDWINKFIIMALQVLLKMNRFHTIVYLGKAWMSLCEGHYNEKLLPILINASPLAGMDDAPFKAAMEVVMRDKNQALDNLDKLRLTIRERLGDVTLLNHHIGTKIRKKKKAKLNHPQANRVVSRADSLKGSQADQDFDDQSSLVSVYTYKTQSSSHSKGSQPDFIALPAEYERVIEQLKKRSEKAAMILAIAELGDVHAHFGNWGGATTAWNDALDTLLGPYQVIRHWRKLLDGQSKEQILQQYGVHGCLLAGAILVGKLSRYSYFSSTGQRLEAARLGATLLAPLFSANITHPQRPVNFATYVPRAVWDGVDLFSDAYKCNVTDLQSGLEGIASILMEAGLFLEALPVISLWEHLTLHVMRNLKATVLCRLMRTRALVRLGLMSEASEVLIDLMRGARLPDPTLDTDYVVKNEDGSVLQTPMVPTFSNRKYPGDPTNRATLTFIGEGPLPVAVEKLYGSWAVAHLAMARADWLTKLGAMPNLWKACHPSTGREATSDLPLPDPIEPQLLSWATTLIDRALAMAHGKPLPPESGRESSPAGVAAKAAKAGAKPAAAPDKKKEDKKGASAAASAPASLSAQAMAVAAAAAPAEPSRFLQDAQRAHVMVHALLRASKVALLQWQPLRALQHAMEATRFMGSRDESSVQGPPLMEENDEVDRLTISASMWMAARLQTVKCLVQLRHARPCYALVAAALKEAEQANDGLAAVQLLHAQGQMQEVEGQSADALNTYNEVIARYQSLALRCDLRAAEALSDAASLRDRLGLRQDSVRLGQAAFNMLEAWVRGIGLEERKEHPELINIYSDGTTMFVRALLHMGRCCSRARDHRGAAKHFAHAFSLLRVHTRALPSQHAAAALALGRALKHVVLLEPLSPGDLPPTLLPLPSNPQSSTDPSAANAPPPVGAAAGRSVPSSTPRAGSPPQKGTATTAAASAADGLQAGRQQLHEGVGSSPFAGAVAAAIASGAAPGVASPSAPWIGLAQEVLHQALILAALDGGHLRQIMRAALLELGSLYMACALPRCGAACLAHADAVSSKADTLMLANHMLAPVAVDKMPEWAKEYVRGQEDAFVAQQDNKAAAPTALADADLGRMLVCHFLSLMRASPSLPAEEAVRAEAQMIYLHSSLLTACPRYASDACFSSVPLPPAIHEAAPAHAPGRVIVQWYPQDGCWQSDRSWQTGGSLGLSSHVTDKDVLNLQPVPQFASLLYAVVNQRGSVRTGELTFEVPAVRGIQRRVKELRNRCESPKAPTDLFGYDAPTARELSGIRTASERFLGMRRVSEDGAGWGASLSPHDSEDLDAPSITGPASTKEGGSPVSSPAPRSSTLGAAHAGRGAAKGAAVAAKPEPVGPPPTDLNFLIKLEALLALEGGLDLVDPSLAEWLSTVLPSDS